MGLFFVNKKDGNLRLMRPPKSKRGGAESLGEIDLSPVTLSRSGFGPVAEMTVTCGTVDVKDSFFQYSVRTP